MNSTTPNTLSKRNASSRSTTLPAFLLMALCSAGILEGQNEELTLRVNDIEAVAGEQTAIVVRTYASRPISQGQLCLRASGNRRAGAPTGPFLSLDDWIVYSANGDVLGSAGLNGSDEIVIDFNSAAASINTTDGPLLVIRVTLAEDLLPGELLAVAIDPAGTFLEDEAGMPVQVDLRSGDLTIVDASAPLTLSAEAEDTEAGSVARLSIATERVLPWISGFVEFAYPASIANALPTVQVDPRYGNASLVVLYPSSGVVSIDFQSADQSLNTLPGEVIQILLPIRTDAPTGTYPLSISPLTAQVRDVGGVLRTVALQNLEIENDPLEVINATLFTDGFETGDSSAWSP